VFDISGYMRSDITGRVINIAETSAPNSCSKDMVVISITD